MKPEYVNTFGLRKVSDKQGEILEITWTPPINIWKIR